jgi:predicted RecB family endonuclease
MKSLIPAIAVSGLVSVASMAQSGTLPKAARAGIDAGNQAWIDGEKTGNIPLISATYAEDAVDVVQQENAPRDDSSSNNT